MINKRLLNCPSSSGDQGDLRTGLPARKPACFPLLQQPSEGVIADAVSATDNAWNARPPGAHVPMQPAEIDRHESSFARCKRLIVQHLSQPRRGDSDTASAIVLAPEENPTQVRVHKVQSVNQIQDTPADPLSQALPSAMLRPQIPSDTLPDTEKIDALPATMSLDRHRDAAKHPLRATPIHQSCPPPELSTCMEKTPAAPLDQHPIWKHGDEPHSLQAFFGLRKPLPRSKKHITDGTERSALIPERVLPTLAHKKVPNAKYIQVYMYSDKYKHTLRREAIVLMSSYERMCEDM